MILVTIDSPIPVPSFLFFVVKNGSNILSRSYSLMIGPEGDFSDTEMNNIQNKENYFTVSLGDTVLKSETASITAAAILKDSLLND